MLRSWWRAAKKPADPVAISLIELRLSEVFRLQGEEREGARSSIPFLAYHYRGLLSREMMTH
jgi:hypothetical protein